MEKCLFLKPNKELASTCSTRLQTLPYTQLAFTHNYRGHPRRPRVHDRTHSATPITLLLAQPEPGHNFLMKPVMKIDHNTDARNSANRKFVHALKL